VARALEKPNETFKCYFFGGPDHYWLPANRLR
jgi:hypothetical protein